MRRRDFLALTAGATLAVPLRALAQQPRMKRLAFIFTLGQDDPDTAKDVAAMRAGLSSQG